MNKAELTAAVAQHVDVDAKMVAKVLAGVEDVVGATVRKGDKVTVTGFISFARVDRKARKGRNPATGESIRIKASKGVRVAPGLGLRKVVKGDAPAVKLAKPARKPVAVAKTAKTPAAKAVPAKKVATKAVATKTVAAKTVAGKAVATKAVSAKTTRSVPSAAAPQKAAVAKKAVAAAPRRPVVRTAAVKAPAPKAAPAKRAAAKR